MNDYIPNPEAMRPLLARAATGAPLSEDEAEKAFTVIMSGQATPAQIGAFLLALRVRGETVDEVTGAARILRAKSLSLEAPEGAIDTCGTGGDASGTYNISTAAALVAAGAGVPVAKHGNRAMSSKSGSADVLAALGVNIDADIKLVKRCLFDANIGFLMAPRYHVAMRHVGPVRMELGTRTIFNLLGPLANPAKAKRQVVGVFSPEWVKPLAEVLGRLGTEHAWVVHGSDGLDELTTTGSSVVAEMRDGAVSTFEVVPEDAGLPRAKPEDLKGGDAHANAGALRAVLGGTAGPYRDIVVLNAAAALVVADRAPNLRAAAEMAAAVIDGGAAQGALYRLVEISSQGAA